MKKTCDHLLEQEMILLLSPLNKESAPLELGSSPQKLPQRDKLVAEGTAELRPAWGK